MNLICDLRCGALEIEKVSHLRDFFQEKDECNTGAKQQPSNRYRSYHDRNPCANTHVINWLTMRHDTMSAAVE